MHGRQLNALTNQILAIAGVALILSILIGYFKNGQTLDTLFLTAVAFSVSAIPTGLPAVVTAVETALERDLSLEIMRGEGKRTARRFSAGDHLVEQGDASESSNIVYLVLDGVLEVVVDGEVVGELGPGAIVGERAQLEDGTRTATLRAKTAGKVVGVPGEELNREALEQVAAGRSREDG